MSRRNPMRLTHTTVTLFARLRGWSTSAPLEDGGVEGGFVKFKFFEQVR